MKPPDYLEVEPGVHTRWEKVIADPVLKVKALGLATERLRALAVGVRLEMSDVKHLAGPDAAREAWDDFRASLAQARSTRYTADLDLKDTEEEGGADDTHTTTRGL